MRCPVAFASRFSAHLVYQPRHASDAVTSTNNFPPAEKHGGNRARGFLVRQCMCGLVLLRVAGAHSCIEKSGEIVAPVIPTARLRNVPLS